MDLSVIDQQTDLISLVVDRYNCYPGEQLTLAIRFMAPISSGWEIQLTLPRVMAVEAYVLPEEMPEQSLSIIEREQSLILRIPLNTNLKEGQFYVIKIKIRVNTFYLNQYLLTRVVVQDDQNQIKASESIQVAVFGKGKYLQFLPEIYENDEFIGRFLMLFESFWKPISQQIDQINCYFDPNLTPETFIPWLSSWVGLPVDASLPIERVRALLKNAMMFNQCRGTQQALKTYLEIYTSGQVVITEKRSRNFILGERSVLGVEIALGKDNLPNSIQINIRLPREELNRLQYNEDMYQRKMMSLVRMMVPAHTIYDVHCVFEN